MTSDIYICLPGEYVVYMDSSICSETIGRHEYNGRLCVVQGIHRSKVKIKTILDSAIILADPDDLIESAEYGCDETEDLMDDDCAFDDDREIDEVRTGDELNDHSIISDYDQDGALSSRCQVHQTHLEQAMRYFYEADYVKALECFLQLLDVVTDPVMVVSIIKHSFGCIQSAGDAERILALLMRDQHRQLCCRDATLKSFVGYCHLLVGQVEQARCWIMEAVRENPHSFTAHYHLARMHNCLGEADHAFREFEICCTNCRVGTTDVDITMVLSMCMNIAYELGMDHILTLKILLTCINLASARSFLIVSNGNAMRRLQARAVRSITCEAFHRIGSILEHLADDDTQGHRGLRILSKKQSFLRGALDAYHLSVVCNDVVHCTHVNAYTRLKEELNSCST